MHIPLMDVPSPSAGYIAEEVADDERRRGVARDALPSVSFSHSRSRSRSSLGRKDTPSAGPCSTCKRNCDGAEGLRSVLVLSGWPVRDISAMYAMSCGTPIDRSPLLVIAASFTPTFRLILRGDNGAVGAEVKFDPNRRAGTTTSKKVSRSCYRVM